MPEFTEDLILAAIAAASAIIGVMLGARLSKKTDLALKKREEKIANCKCKLDTRTVKIS